ncbi:MAG TPA: hypothetical protein VMI09_13885 [Candidatus Binataceae bacterium]|nr:hypothetical protein [Candidatus Binataceae bacterium]
MKGNLKLKWSSALRHLALAMLTFACAACGGAFGTANPTAPGNTSQVPAENSLWVLGTPGTPFQALVTDSSQSWSFRGVVPEAVVIVNNAPGTQMTVTKLTNNSALMTTQLFNGVTLVAEASTNDPFGTTVVQTFGGLTGVAPHANPDIRIFMKGPASGLLTGLVEDLSLSFVFEARAPTLFLFEHPDARVDAIINSVDTAGTIIADIQSNGVVAVQASGGPRLLIKFP